MRRIRLRFLLAGLLVVASACGDDDNGAAVAGPSLDVPAPLVEGPITAGRAIILQGTSFPLADVGYMEKEFFVSGVARAFANVGELDSDGNWEVEESSSADYRTRIVVRRPIDPTDFKGTVMVEWLNVSAGFDSAPDWISGHVELIRRGWVWVGVSAQFAGVEGGGGMPLIPGIDFVLKTADPARYGSLAHPGDSFSYDIYSQVGRAMRVREGIDPLGGLAPNDVIAAGESQSASRMVTYVNAFAKAAGIFDGYLIHSRLGGAAGLSQAPQPAIAAPGVVRIRTDLDVPVLTLQSETDLILLGSAPDRQGDSEYFRWWEVAGTSHADTYTLLVGMRDTGDDPRAAELVVTAAPIPPFVECDNPINSGPHHFVLKAGIRALENWVRDGVPPPSSPLLQLTEDMSEYIRDDVGNTLGGIRTPYVDAPLAQLLGESPGGSAFCFLFGKTIPFDENTIDRLYTDNQAYLDAVEASTQAAVEAGFLLPADADLILTAADNTGYKALIP